MKRTAAALGILLVCSCAAFDHRGSSGPEDHVRACYKPALASNPGLAGDVTVTVQVAATGEVVDVAVIENEIDEPTVARCIADAAARWKLPPPEDGVVKYKLTFALDPVDGRSVPAATIGPSMSTPQPGPALPPEPKRPPGPRPKPD